MVVLLALGAAGAGVAPAGPVDDTALEVFEILNRPAASLVPAIEPHVGAEGAVTAHGSSLIVRAPRERLGEIRRLVATLDVAAPMLRLTVERQEGRSAERTQLGGSVAVGSEGVAVAGAARQDAARSLGTDTQILLLMDGAPGVVDLGVEVPVTGVVAAPGGEPVPTMGYAAVVDGVSVVPHLTGGGQRVELELWLEGGRVLEDGRLERDVVRTTVSGQLGEWIEIASVVRELASRGTGLLGLSRELARRETSLRVRVEPGS